MKSLSVIIVCCLTLIVFNSCTNNKLSVDFIKGKWKNDSALNSVIEFSESGDYYVIMNGEKVDVANLKYSLFPPDKRYNIKIFETTGFDKIVNYGNIEIIDKDKIVLTIYFKDRFVSSAGFTRL